MQPTQNNNVRPHGTEYRSALLEYTTAASGGKLPSLLLDVTISIHLLPFATRVSVFIVRPLRTAPRMRRKRVSPTRARAGIALFFDHVIHLA